MKLLKIELAALFAFIICIFLSTYNLDKSCEGIREGVLRLHVIAASDSKEDQQIKLELRDEILKKGAAVFSQSDTKEEAEEKISASITELENEAKSFLQSKSYPEEVSVSLDKSFFPTRKYNNFTLPAGTYDALKIVIGKGEGKNWWCIMFPALCLPAAEGKEAGFDGILTEDQLNIITKEKYEVRLWLVEKWQEIKNYINN